MKERIEAALRQLKFDTPICDKEGGKWSIGAVADRIARAVVANDSPAATDPTAELVAACEMVLKRWTFDSNQCHTHNWHDMQDCKAAILAALAKHKKG